MAGGAKSNFGGQCPLKNAYGSSDYYSNIFHAGLSGWGIAYYINDTLIPVLRLRRNVTYTFIVEAGNDPNDGPNYHPFYITNSEDGGILLDTSEDRMVSVLKLLMYISLNSRFNCL